MTETAPETTASKAANTNKSSLVIKTTFFPGNHELSIR